MTKVVHFTPFYPTLPVAGTLKNIFATDTNSCNEDEEEEIHSEQVGDSSMLDLEGAEEDVDIVELTTEEEQIDVDSYEVSETRISVDDSVSVEEGDTNIAEEDDTNIGEHDEDIEELVSDVDVEEDEEVYEENEIEEEDAEQEAVDEDEAEDDGENEVEYNEDEVYEEEISDEEEAIDENEASNDEILASDEETEYVEDSLAINGLSNEYSNSGDEIDDFDRTTEHNMSEELSQATFNLMADLENDMNRDYYD